MLNSHASILEAIVTTEGELGMHVAPMGPEVSSDFQQWTLKPFQTSTTFANLYRHHRCVVHVCDHSMLLAKAVLGQANGFPANFEPEFGYLLDDACHWFALEVVAWNVEQPRAMAECRVKEQRVIRPFYGWNRAKHAIVELAILVSRAHLLEAGFLEDEVKRLKVLVDKTGGQNEHQAYDLLIQHLRQSLQYLGTDAS
jgi:uncharacterized protein